MATGAKSSCHQKESEELRAKRGNEKKVNKGKQAGAEKGTKGEKRKNSNHL